MTIKWEGYSVLSISIRSLCFEPIKSTWAAQKTCPTPGASNFNTKYKQNLPLPAGGP